MPNTIKKITAWSALAAAVLMVVLFAASSGQRSKMLVDTGETTSTVKTSLATLSDLKAGSLDDPVLLDAVKDFSQSRYVGETWLLDPAGKTRYVNHGGRRAELLNNEGGNAYIKDILDALPQEELSDEQRTMLLISTSLQGGGDHNDVFHYRVEKLTGEDGKTIGYLAFAYPINPAAADSPDALYMTFLLGFIFCALVYWFSLPLWAWLDARQHGEKAWVWAIFILLGNLAALIAYLLVRQPAAKRTAT